MKSLTASHALQVFQPALSDMRFLAQRREQESCQQSAVRGAHGCSGLCQALSCDQPGLRPSPQLWGTQLGRNLRASQTCSVVFHSSVPHQAAGVRVAETARAH